MTHQIIEQTSFDGRIYQVVVVDNGDGSFKSFPVDENNPEYVAFLESLETDN